ncbi:MAG: endonuclease domain-containing protein, partial [Actinomycetota bacterium]|nr:endonuclease domain-containing protein [Actinomycetota bacterium]
STLIAADITTLDGVPCTTVARTIFDLTAVLPDRGVERALEQAQVLELLDARALQAQIGRHPTSTGAARLSALTQHLGAPTESELEERLVVLCRRAGLPEPERQVYIDPGDGGPMIRADFVWREQRLIVETDGARYHDTRRAFHADRRRDQRLIRAGWRVIRITWRQLITAPEEVAALLADLLRPSLELS